LAFDIAKVNVPTVLAELDKDVSQIPGTYGYGTPASKVFTPADATRLGALYAQDPAAAKAAFMQHLASTKNKHNWAGYEDAAWGKFVAKMSELQKQQQS
jgi:hypothetical protein